MATYMEGAYSGKGPYTVNHQFIAKVNEVTRLAARCEQAEKNMSHMMLQWEGAITTMEVRMTVIENMFEDLKKMLQEAAEIRDDMNTFLSFVKIPELPKEGGEETS